jgi:hypothetical protein
MSKKLFLILILGILLGIGIAFAAATGDGENLAAEERAAPASAGSAAAEASRLWLSQSDYSTRCATKSGSCRLKSPKKVGTTCTCNGERGRVVR